MNQFVADRPLLTADRPLLAAEGLLAKKGWIVNVQPPPAHCTGPEAALKYLASYVAGSAIGNSRIVRDDGRRVTFRVKDYRHGGRQISARLTGCEFVRRFLLHILPTRLRRVRYFGLMGGSQAPKNMARCQQLLGVEKVASDEAPGASSEEAASLAGDVAGDVFEPDDPLAPTCPKCRAQPMQWVADILPTEAWCGRRFLAFQRHFHRERLLRASRQMAARPPP